MPAPRGLANPRARAGAGASSGGSSGLTGRVTQIFTCSLICFLPFAFWFFSSQLFSCSGRFEPLCFSNHLSLFDHQTTPSCSSPLVLSQEAQAEPTIELVKGPATRRQRRGARHKAAAHRRQRRRREAGRPQHVQVQGRHSPLPHRALGGEDVHIVHRCSPRHPPHSVLVHVQVPWY
jgi:hypothetical protein